MSSSSFSKLGQYGRLCNSMWQLATLISYCKKHNKTPLIPEWEYLKCFKSLPIPSNNIIVDKIYNEPSFTYNEIPNFQYQVDLLGYFQSPKYLDGIDVIELFELKDEYKTKVNELYNNLNPEKLKTCSLHIRRGDYLIEPHLSYHGVLPSSYYSNAIRELYGASFNKIQYLVFSDDIEYCERTFVGLNNIVFVKGNEDIIDLFLMSKCNDNIIANSSFSYWSYLLNQNKAKRCVAPKNWFSGANLDTSDLYLPEMFVI